jgi:hypothetical protein
MQSMRYVQALFLLLATALLSCKSLSNRSRDGSSDLKLISEGGRSYSIKSGIKICFMQKGGDNGWTDIDALNEAFKSAIESEWGTKVGVVTTGWRPCSEMPDAMVKVNFFDCGDDINDCPNSNRSPHVNFIGPPGPGEGTVNIINLRRTFQNHYRFDECNGRKKIIVSIQVRPELEARKRCVRNYAIHEFGHILGFDHEQYHPDGPEKCNDDTFHFAKAGSGAAVWMCSEGYDDTSVMNYCGKVFLNWDGGLSERDVKCAKEFFADKP